MNSSGRAASPNRLSSTTEPASSLGPSGFDPARLAAVIDPVAEAIHASIFDEPLGPEGTIERALYRQAAEAGLRAGVAAFHNIKAGAPA